MSKNRNKRNTRSSLKALKRKRYAEGGQQLYAQRKGEDLDDYQARVTAAQAADPNYNRDSYQQALRGGTGTAAVPAPKIAVSQSPGLQAAPASAPASNNQQPSAPPPPDNSAAEAQAAANAKAAADAKAIAAANQASEAAKRYSFDHPTYGMLTDLTKAGYDSMVADAATVSKETTPALAATTSNLTSDSAKDTSEDSAALGLEQIAEEERKKRQSWYDNGSGYSGPPSTPAQKEYYDHLKSLEKKSTEEKNVIINARNQNLYNKQADLPPTQDPDYPENAGSDAPYGYNLSGDPLTKANFDYLQALGEFDKDGNGVYSREELKTYHAYNKAKEDGKVFDKGPLNVENKSPEAPELTQATSENALGETTGADIGAAQKILSSPPVDVTDQVEYRKRLAARNLLDNAGLTTPQNLQQINDVGADAGDPSIGYEDFTASTGTASTATKPTDLILAGYKSEDAVDLAATDAAQGTVGDKSTASPVEIRMLTERAEAGDRDAQQELAARQAAARELTVSDESQVGQVDVREPVTLTQAEAAEAAGREAITGTKATGEQAEIIKTVGFEAAQRRTVTGTAAKDGASKMLVVVGDLPEDVSASIVEDPAEFTASVDEQPVEVRAAIASLPTEALVSSQMESLLAGMDEGETPAWARPAVQQVNAMLAQRGLSTSTVGRDALFNAIIQTAMPMAQSNAQALQATAAQNLNNQQQAAMTQATQSMQLRLTNLGNRQTAGSQTAQMAQQMKTMQSQFTQDAVMTTEQMQQQTRTQNLSNRQQAAQVDAQNIQAMAAQSLGNEQQIELANLQYMNATETENMSAVQQERLAEMQVAADFLSKNASFDQQMKLANLTNDQQMRLANLSAQNQAGSETLSAEQQTELANLNNRMQTNLTAAKIAESMGVAQLNVDQQRAVTNASVNANIDLTKFSADQQVAVANSKFMQSMTMADFNAEQQEAMQNATALATMDMAAVDQRTKVSITNAQSFLGMDMANLSNNQQGVILDQQMKQQRLLSDQSSANAALQFNATSKNQINQFNNNLAAQMQQFNTSQSNAMEQFNKSETTKIAAMNAGNQLQADTSEAQLQADIDKFNEQQELQRETWNSANAQAVEQSNIQWRRQANTAGTAAANAANQQNVQNAYNISALDQTQLWQQLRDEATYIRQAYESNEGREAQLLATAIGNEGGIDEGSATGTQSLLNVLKSHSGGSTPRLTEQQIADLTANRTAIID
jgi:hypothetical protein